MMSLNVETLKRALALFFLLLKLGPIRIPQGDIARNIL
jgi:hypothetical protein